MNISEPGVKHESVRYLYTPSSFAEQTLLYPTRSGHYLCDRAYHFSFRNPIALEPSHRLHYMLFYIEKGKMQLSLEGRQYKAQQGCAVLFNCRQEHEYFSMTDDMIFDWLVFDGFMVPTLYDRILEIHDDNHVFLLSGDSGIRGLFHRMHSYAEDLKRTSEVTWSELIYSMICCLFRGHACQSAPDVRLMEEAMRYIDRSFKEEIMVPDIAKHMGFSNSYFNRKFRRQTGYSPHEYLTICRISYAKDLLLSTDDTVSDIAFDSGFKSEENFIRAFTKTVGVTPASYRKFPV